jgi:hypothetical protein
MEGSALPMIMMIVMGLKYSSNEKKRRSLGKHSPRRRRKCKEDVKNSNIS